MDLISGQDAKLKVNINFDNPNILPYFKNVKRYISRFGYNISPTGKRAIFDARGDIFTVPAKKGITLYDRLVESGKLEESWEMDLKDIEVSLRQRGNNQELVVKFTRSKGDPQTVYIFFSEKGEYNGSNFTGD